jgi:hypothetical protein
MHWGSTDRMWLVWCVWRGDGAAAAAGFGSMRRYRSRDTAMLLQHGQEKQNLPCFT